ncbi:adult-specific cuticular protein ACP-20-like [Musca domestica]|uniref:Adult-specific cuticular protein ACP-20-like n=1 Tax=Musca domestica TaxID=7370 RepID=A0A9J7CL97_MUSDO|nr:adult-specific cuticular protein ACP-20-like [Musca domestica]
MRFAITLFAIFATCAALTIAGPLPYKQHFDGSGSGSGGSGHATSYAVVTKHEDTAGGEHGGQKGYGDAKNDHYGGHGHGHVDGHGDDYNSHPRYEFAYGVEDSKTGDVKEHQESRDGDNVKGSYSLKESDGTTRLVTYTSDKKNGFEATVHKIGQANGAGGKAEHSGYYDH